MQKGKNYLILFIDPNGTQHIDWTHKINGFSRIFETVDKKEPIVYDSGDLKIIVRLLLMPATGGIAGIPEEYREYWFDHFKDLEERLA